MDINKLLGWVAPLPFGALLGLYWTVHGLFYTLYGTPAQKRDYPLEIILGLPLAAFCVAIHILIRRITGNNTLYSWIIESVLVGLLIYGFYRS